jgi:hypothetical protein
MAGFLYIREMDPCPHDLEIVNRGPVVWIEKPRDDVRAPGEPTVTATVAGERAYTLRCKLCGHEAIRVIRISV